MAGWQAEITQGFVFFSSSAAGEKRKPSEPLPHEENKRPRVVGDIPVDLINEVMATIADPAAVPEVSQRSSPRRRCSGAKHKNPSLRRLWPLLHQRNQTASI